MINILIIDDENTARMAMESIFSSYGSCKSFATGKDAISVYKNFLKDGDKFDLILLDIFLENESGWEILLKIRQLEKEVGLAKKDYSKIIMATGNSDLKMVQECIKAGCNDYIIKPLKAKTVAPKMAKFNFEPLKK